MPSPSLPLRSRGVPVPPSRRKAAQQVLKAFRPGQRVVLTTHVNADGDGAGSEVALAHCLEAIGCRPVIANATGFPDRYRFLLDGRDDLDAGTKGVRALEKADLIVVLDIADLERLGQLGPFIVARGVPVVCIDHHVGEGALPDGPRLLDAAAAATGELLYDLVRVARWDLVPAAARGLYVAMLTDTGGFRFSNTSPRVLRIAGDLLECGLDAENVYSAVYASAPEGRVRLTGEVLETLVVEAPIGLAWVTVPPGAMERLGATSEDLDGVIEFPRSIAGVRLAMLFRQLGNGRIKISFRSMAGVDVSELAGQFGGGGHRKAAGASLAGSLAEVQATVLAAARAVLTA